MPSATVMIASSGKKNEPGYEVTTVKGIYQTVLYYKRSMLVWLARLVYTTIVYMYNKNCCLIQLKL